MREEVRVSESELFYYSAFACFAVFGIVPESPQYLLYLLKWFLTDFAYVIFLLVGHQ